MERSPFALAALANSAVPGLAPASVEAIQSDPDQDFDVAFVTDTSDRRWVVRAPRSEVAAARMDQTLRLLALLGRRVPFSVPTPKGFASLKDSGRVAVYPYLPGHNLNFDALPAGPGLAAELGRSIAALHNVDVALFDEAGMPAYDADEYRGRRLADLDRAAATGRVPTSLLTRWERALEDVTLWRFAPTPIHGDLTGDQVLAVFEDDKDAASGKIKAFTGWEDAKVADPADDFSALVADADPAALETVMEAYAHARVERPDPNLLVRARLAAELRLLGELQRALTAGWTDAADAHSAALRRLDDQVHAAAEAENDYHRTSLSPAAPRQRSVPAPAIVDDDEDEDELPAMTPASAAGAVGATTAGLDEPSDAVTQNEMSDATPTDPTREDAQQPASADAADDETSAANTAMAAPTTDDALAVDDQSMMDDEPAGEDPLMQAEQPVEMAEEVVTDEPVDPDLSQHDAPLPAAPPPTTQTPMANVEFEFDQDDDVTWDEPAESTADTDAAPSGDDTDVIDLNAQRQTRAATESD